jgi:hypothetical protein
MTSRKRRPRKFKLTADSTYREIREARKATLLSECDPFRVIRRNRTTKHQLITIALDQRDFLRNLGY